MKPLLVLLAATASLLAQARTQPGSGEIRGIVIDQSGAPVSAALVYAVPQSFGLNDAIPHSVKTDRNGSFDFHGSLALGSYKLCAQKVEESYPDPLDSFYADTTAVASVVDLTEEHPSAAATVKLGRKAAVVAGRIVDANTGTPLKAHLGFVDDKGYGHSIEVDGNYRILVPPGKEVTLMVRLPGTPYDRSFLPVAPVKLEAGQYVNLDIPVRQ